MRTRVGYAGGTTPSPTYHRLGDHAETVQVDFDTSATSFDALLEGFWSWHDPTAPAPTRQYASAIWAADEAQAAAAKRSRDRVERTAGRPVLTEILPLERFWPAEAYHQKYRLRADRVLFVEFREMYPDDEALIASTAAARVNGYLGGGGRLDDLLPAVGSFGLSERGRARLLEVVAGSEDAGAR